MLRLRRKTKNTPSQRIATRRTLPVDRYYSSMSTRRASDPRQSRRMSDSNQNIASITRRPARTAKELFGVGLRWAGFVGIFIVVITNILLNDVGVKIAPQSAQNLYRNDDEYVSQVSSAFSGSVFYRTKATFDSDAFETSLRQMMPEIDVATAVVPLVGHKLQVGLLIAQPLSRVQLSPTRQGILADNGVIVQENTPEIISSKYSELPLLKLEPSVSLSAGEVLLTSGEVELIKLLKLEFDGSDKNRPLLNGMTYAVTKRELSARFDDAPFYTRFTTVDKDARTQVGAAIATIRQMQEQGTIPQEYIDARVSGRVFVK